MEQTEIHWKNFQESLLLRSQLERYDLLDHSTPRDQGKNKIFEDCSCGLPNKKYCMLSAKSTASSAQSKTRKKYVWVPMSICSV